MNSRSKGARNERDVSRLFEKWTGYKFSRTPSSGGLHWKKTQTSGDIVCIDKKHGARFGFSVECKFHEELDLLHNISGLIGKKSNKIIEFWEQASNDAQESEKIPIVFMRRNGMKSDTHFVIISHTYLRRLKLLIGHIEMSKGYITYTSPDYDLVILNSEDLFKMDYKIFHKASIQLIRETYGTSE